MMLGVKVLFWDPRRPFPSSPLTSTSWDSRYMEASCKGSPASRAGLSKHRAPEETCNCGVHALSALWLLQYYATDVLQCYLENEQPHLFVCLLEGSGNVVLHETGWRAEYVEVLGVASFPGQAPEKEPYNLAYRAAAYFNVAILNFQEINEALMWSYHISHKPHKSEQDRQHGAQVEHGHEAPTPQPQGFQFSPLAEVCSTSVGDGWEGVVEQMQKDEADTSNRGAAPPISELLNSIAHFQEVGLCEREELLLYSRLLSTGLIHVLPPHFTRAAYRQIKAGRLDLDGELLGWTQEQASAS